ncbi:DUF2293 domain-containing protein [Desulfogranum japonicum]|uniref:DUF2293 domain-containing protein n=1 Tax=Desulfogranum japonicum TaxID=231447 RepID=UPI000416DD8B|nr:DUF2293 domain-containing protein [Desulfogranum japonicum]
MPDTTRIVKPGHKEGTVLTEDNQLLIPPDNWAFLPAGDGPLTRNVKKRGPHWQVQVKKRKRDISMGIWIQKEHITAGQKEIEEKRNAPEYSKRREAEQKRRQKKHEAYVEEFYQATLDYLRFPAQHAPIAEKLALAVTKHATPVGSGTVARTSRLPIERKVAAAVIAWMRHQTTLYDSMRIARIKGKRREVRRELAEKSQQVLNRYRKGESVSIDCPLLVALTKQD